MSNPVCSKSFVDARNRKIHLHWDDGLQTGFHFVWLRHSARCPRGMPNDTAVKIDLLPDDPSTLVVTDTQLGDDRLVINWADDNLVTEHSLAMLYQSAYDAQSRQKRKHRPILWGVDNASEIPLFEFSSLDQNKIVLEMLIAVCDYGIARIEGVPTEPGTIANVGECFGPIHVNNYGRIFDVKTQSNVTLGSNTGANLGPHTDEGYRHAPPGISLFHCLVASQLGGGESILVDGFNAALMLRQQDPESFNTLTNVPVFYQRLALPEENMQAHGRLIVTDIDGEVIGVRFTDRTIPPQDLPDDLIEPVYKAIKAYWDIVNSEELKFQYLMQPGDLHVFDNHRVLHGRTGFNANATQRHLQQCSVNRDEFHNRLRVLAAQQGHPVQYMTLSDGAMG